MGTAAKLKICFYYIDEQAGDGYEAFEPRPVKYSSLDSHQLDEALAAHNWQGVIDAVKRLKEELKNDLQVDFKIISLQADEGGHKNNESNKDKEDKEDKKDNKSNTTPPYDIIILLADTWHLTKRESLNNLVTTEADEPEKQKRRLRYASTLHPRIEHRTIKDQKLHETELMRKMRPIITISTEDISTLFAEREPFNPDVSGSKILYQIRFDDRVKFWDSSIWHRYVALNKDFQKNLKQVLLLMADCHQKKLYDSYIAQENLELQTRVMLSSYLCSLGDHSHGRVVTPFKFHSELDMRMQKKKLAAEIRSVLNWPDPNSDAETTNMKDDAFWRMLLIDDYAHAQLHSHLPENKSISGLSKLEIIQSVMDMPEDIGKGWVAVVPVEPEPQPNQTQQDPVSEDISEKAVQKLSESVYDMLLLDYLLGKAKDSRNEREYGYDFLFKLQTGHANGKPAGKVKLKKGPLNKYWILPISSFPFAFSDKLRQLGMEGQSDHWIMSGGGDPITTPELFCYNLLDFIKQQISEFYLTKESVLELLENYSGIESGKLWRELVLNAFDRLELRRMILENDEHNGSLFAQQMLSFIRNNYEHNQFVRQLKSIIENIADIPYFKIDDTLKSINPTQESKELSDQTILAISILLKERSAMFFQTEAFFERCLISAGQNTASKIEFDSRRLRWLPDNINHQLPESVTFLRLSNNDLTILPANITECKNLTKLDLSYNSLKALPKGLNNLDKLEYLDLTGNSDLPAYLQRKHEGLKEIKQLSHKAQSWNTERTKKVAISYAHEDKGDFKELLNILKILDREGAVKHWIDDDILPGSEWETEIKRAFLDADIILFIVSRHFLASDYIINVEMKISLERYENKECTVIPIFLKSCYLPEEHKILSIKGANTPEQPILSFEKGEADEAWTKVEKLIRASLKGPK